MGPGARLLTPVLLLLCCLLLPVMLMFITTTWAESATLTAVIAYAFFYGGFGQMVAGVFEVGVPAAVLPATLQHLPVVHQQRSCICLQRGCGRVL
jgi:hypothetical protein